MKATKINELESVYEAALKLLTGESSVELKNESLQQVFAPTFFVYGPSPEVRSNSIQELREQIARQQNQYTSSPLFENFHEVFRKLSPDKKAAVYVDEFYLKDNNNSEDSTLRISTIFFRTDEGWKVSHIHFSYPYPPSQKINTFLNDTKWKKEKAALEQLLEEKTNVLNETLEVLKGTREQLLQKEKLASLGQLTAGIAHEIKNPLNFINNFSELSSEFLMEIDENLEKIKKNETTEEIKLLLEDVKANLTKIHQHGTRADGIVKSMLLHSRGGNGKMEYLDLNALIAEYVNLAFHGMRANKNPINVDIKTDIDPHLGMVKMNAESFSRVILNLCKNAFDAMREKLEKEENNSFAPRLTIRTRSENQKVVVEIEDNGPGVSESIKEKLTTPFFTTKKGNEGTGLGLSISMDIIQAHGGSLEITSREGDFTCFSVVLNKNGPETGSDH